jgi:hypothetical protein
MKPRLRRCMELRLDRGEMRTWVEFDAASSAQDSQVFSVASCRRRLYSDRSPRPRQAPVSGRHRR